MESTFAVFIPSESSPSFLGKVVIVSCAMEHQHQSIRGEVFTFIERPSSLSHNELYANGNGYPPEAYPLNLDAMVDAGKEVGKLRVLDQTSRISGEKNDLCILAKSFCFEKLEKDELRRHCYFEKFRGYLMALERLTRCEDLVRFIRSIESIPQVVVKPTVVEPI
ncbi:MAG: hypothetical protein M3Q32_05660 [Pseudomonadota bacterium]|nr:hypothetical protein [Pseudomonadota bacterium]